MTNKLYVDIKENLQADYFEEDYTLDNIEVTLLIQGGSVTLIHNYKNCDTLHYSHSSTECFARKDIQEIERTVNEMFYYAIELI